MSRTQHVLATLRQMLALLEGERQALAAMDLDRIATCTSGKLVICETLEAVQKTDLDEECLGLLDAVKRLNEINRRLRNMIATNVQNRLSALTGAGQAYAAHPRTAPRLAHSSASNPAHNPTLGGAIA